MRVLIFLKLQLEARRVGPEIFQTVQRALFVVEDVNDHVGVIHDDPLARRIAVHGHGRDVMLELEPFLHLPRDRFQMWLGCACADDEIIGERGDAAEIERDDVLGFFVGGILRAEAGELVGFNGMAPGKGDLRR